MRELSDAQEAWDRRTGTPLELVIASYDGPSLGSVANAKDRDSLPWQIAGGRLSHVVTSTSARTIAWSDTLLIRTS